MNTPYNEALGATLIERARREKIVIVGVTLPGHTTADTDAGLDELELLIDTAGADVVARIEQTRDAPDHTWYIGKGKAEELKEICLAVDADTVVFDNELAPAQQYNLEKLLGRTALDRTAVILDIFAQNAHTLEGKAQVELALLRYRLPRLRRGATARLSQQRGGIGGRFGSGETKLEVDRRRIMRRISKLEGDLRNLQLNRNLQRKGRVRSGLAAVTIVGYTNAGKSTLLNRLTHAGVLVEDRLFATLDPTTRRLRFPRDREIVISDTVGFIRDLPKDLLRAFRATLEELDQADLLLHVIDAADPRREEQTAAVARLLGELKLDGKRRLLVFNKADRAGWVEAEALAREGRGLAIAANDRATLRPLLLAIERVLWEEDRLPPSAHREPPAGDGVEV